MKLFCKEEMQALEGRAEGQGVTMAVLMEQAGRALAVETESRCRPVQGKRTVLLCGRGNNGGDGFVCARYLAGSGMECAVILAQGLPETELARQAYDMLPEEVPCMAWDKSGEAARLLEQADVIVDCVFGFGFRGELSGPAADLIGAANGQNCLKIAADLPSGVECDTGRVSSVAFRADITVAFTAKKPAHCSYPAKEFCGETVVRQVGVPPELIMAAKTRCFEPDKDFCRAWLKEPETQSNKGDLGRLLLVCGSYGMAGACIMAARAALRCGAGLVVIAVEESIYPIVAQAVPEAVFLPLSWQARREESEELLCQALEKASACLVGCGLGELAETVCPVVFSHCAVPLVVDADALNFAARHPGVLERGRAPLILTPHPGEMARLEGKAIPEVQADRLDTALKTAGETGAVTVLKGAATVIAGPDGRRAVNPTGNPGMAKGGSGDVLAGMIASFSAQGIPPFETAVLGAYLHGLAGDLCAAELGTRAMLPTDLLSRLPEAFLSLL